MNTQEAIKILERDAPNYADFSIVSDYDDAVLKYRQALTHAIEVMKRWQWMPITDAPIDGTLWFMLGHPDYAVSEIGYYNKRYNVWVDGSDRTLFMPHGPTNFMSLPEPPQKSKD